MPAPRESSRRGAELLAPEQAGMATVWAVCWMAVCLTVGWVGIGLAAAEAHQHHVDGAADLTAVSAAARLQRGGDACAAAVTVAEVNDVLLADCRLEAEDVVVTVREEVDLPFGIRRWVWGEARAGPS